MPPICIYIFMFQLIITVNSQFDRPFTNIKQGGISGTVLNSVKGREIYSFRGIPFAKPPVNELRFKLPVPAEPWEGTFRAVGNEVISCPQLTTKDVYEGQEDCLVLNVYAPATYFKTTSNLPVMVFIHGGAFIRETGMDPRYLPTRLLDRDVILVTINYRLGILGFLSSGDEVIPGNFALFDQIQALKWIQENIHSFGGDPGKVTLFGQSVGSTAITLLLASAHSQNLFHGVIAQSGTYFGLRAMSTNPRKWAKRLAMRFQCPSVTMEQLLACLMTKSPEELVKALNYFQMVGSLPKIFAPVVENRPDGLLQYDPQIDFHRITPDIPIMIGTVSGEGYHIYRTFEPYFDQLNEQFIEIDLPEILKGIFDFEGNATAFANAITAYYFRNIEEMDQEEFEQDLMQFYADLYTDVGTERFLNLRESQSNIYVYKFSYRGSVCKEGNNCSYPKNRGPSHGEDLPFLFPFQDLTENDSKVSDIVLDLWTNFATYQNPTPHDNSSLKWLPTSSQDPQYLDINLESSMVPGHLTYMIDAWAESMKAADSSSE